MWREVWAVCQANGLSPAELTAARFASALSAVPPEPKELTDYRIVAEAVRRRGKEVEDARRVFATQLQSLTTEARVNERIRHPDPVAGAVYTHSATLCPLARYLFALSAGRTDLADRFFGEAVAEFALRRVVFAEFLIPHLPPSIVQAADRLYCDARAVSDLPSAAGRMDTL